MPGDNRHKLGPNIELNNIKNELLNDPDNESDVQVLAFGQQR